MDRAAFSTKKINFKIHKKNQIILFSMWGKIIKSMEYFSIGNKILKKN